MTQHHASGSFTVKMLPQPPLDDSPTPGATLGRLRLDKTYQGDLQAAAVGQMLSALTLTAGSAGYVAIEHVTGTLHGRAGSFVLQHTGLTRECGLATSLDPLGGRTPQGGLGAYIARGSKQLTITVVPDSGTDALLGLEGRLDIRIAEGQHFYAFDYALP